MLDRFYFVQLDNHKPFNNDKENIMGDPNYDQLRQLKISPRVICILYFSGMEFPADPFYMLVYLIFFLEF